MKTPRFDYHDDKHDLHRWIRAGEPARQINWHYDIMHDKLTISITLNHCGYCMRLDVGELLMCPEGWRKYIARKIKFLRNGVKAAARNYLEDAHLENGNYRNECCHCHKQFTGHKRRVACRACVEEGKARWDAMTDDQRAAAVEKQKLEISEWMKNREK